VLPPAAAGDAAAAAAAGCRVLLQASAAVLLEATCVGGREVTRGVAAAMRLGAATHRAEDVVLLVGEARYGKGCWLVGRLRCGTSARFPGLLRRQMGQAAQDRSTHKERSANGNLNADEDLRNVDLQITNTLIKRALCEPPN
jgi:hypothetical protein